MRLRPLQQCRQEGLDDVDGPVEVDVDDPVDRLKLEVLERNEGLNDPGDVDHRVHGAVSVGDLGWERFRGRAIGDVHRERRETVAGRGQLDRLVEAFLSDIHRRDLRSSPEQLQHDLPADSVSAPGDRNHLVTYLHETSLGR